MYKIANSSQRDLLPDSAFALVYTDIKGNKVRKYPVNDRQHAVSAIAYFSKNEMSIPPGKRVSTAKNIISAAKNFGVQPNSDVLKYAEDPDIESIKSEMGARIGLSSSEEESKFLSELVKVATETGDFPGFVNALEAFDRKVGNDQYWGGKIQDPARTVYPGMTKTAMDPEFVEKVKRNKDHLSMYLGKAVVNGIIDGRLTENDLDTDILKLLKRLLR